MTNGGFLIHTKTLNIAFLVALYVPVYLFSYRWLIPRLGLTAKRLANGFMLAQVILIALSLAYQSTLGFQWWLWDLNSEWNVPTAFAAAQLILIGFVALVSAWYGAKLKTPLRLYLILIATQFFFLALDELFQFHEGDVLLQEFYKTLGITLVAVTCILAVGVPWRRRIWLLCLLVGLGTAWTGAVELERYRDICGRLGSLQIDGCLEPYHYEEPLELIGVWLALLAVLGLFSDVSVSRRIQQSLYWLPALALALLLLAAPVSPMSFQGVKVPPLVAFEAGEALYAYRIKTFENHIEIRLSLSPNESEFLDGLGYSIHLVDQASGASVLHMDRRVRHDLKFTVGPALDYIYRQVVDLIITPDIPGNRALWVVLTLWREVDGEFVQQKFVQRDLHALNDTQVILDELTLQAAQVSSSQSALATFDNGFALESHNPPDHASAGEALEISFSWRADERGEADLIQFLHFVHEETGAWWGYDQQPLGPRLPTRLWYSGLADSETWTAPLPDDLAPGLYNVFTGLYRTRDEKRIPATDAAGQPWRDARVLLGTVSIVTQ